MRYWTVLTAVSVLVVSGPALARDIRLQIRMSMLALWQSCDQAGGRFSGGPQGYGCGTDCRGHPGTGCVVTCAPGQLCVARVKGGRRARTVSEALRAPDRQPR